MVLYLLVQCLQGSGHLRVIQAISSNETVRVDSSDLLIVVGLLRSLTKLHVVSAAFVDGFEILIVNYTIE